MQRNLLTALVLAAVVAVVPAAAATTSKNLGGGELSIPAKSSRTWAFKPSADATLTSVRVCGKQDGYSSYSNYYFSYALAITAPGDSTRRSWSSSPRFGSTSYASSTARGGSVPLKAGLTYTVKLTNSEAVAVKACNSLYLVQVQYGDRVGTTTYTTSPFASSQNQAKTTFTVVGVVFGLMFCAGVVGVIVFIVWASRRSRRTALQPGLQQPMTVNGGVYQQPGMYQQSPMMQPGMQPGMQPMMQPYQAGMAPPPPMMMQQPPMQQGPVHHQPNAGQSLMQQPPPQQPYQSPQPHQSPRENGGSLFN
jgi:hypothetical protein